MNPVFPAAEPYDTYLFVGVAFGIVCAKRATMFSKTGAFKCVIPAPYENRTSL
jgi:hypothetical protein